MIKESLIYEGLKCYLAANSEDNAYLVIVKFSIHLSSKMLNFGIGQKVENMLPFYTSCIYGPAFVLIAYEQTPPINANAHASGRVRGIIFSMNIHLQSYFAYVSNEGPCERLLAWAFVARKYDIWPKSHVLTDMYSEVKISE